MWLLFDKEEDRARRTVLYKYWQAKSKVGMFDNLNIAVVKDTVEVFTVCWGDAIVSTADSVAAIVPHPRVLGLIRRNSNLLELVHQKCQLIRISSRKKLIN